jgi:hypothetical protein
MSRKIIPAPTIDAWQLYPGKDGEKAAKILTKEFSEAYHRLRDAAKISQGGLYSQLKIELAAFNMLRESMCKTGAADTEPRGVMEEAFERAARELGYSITISFGEVSRNLF